MSKNLPTVTSQIPRDLRNFVDRLRDMINGNGSGRLLSVKDLTDAGLATTDANGNVIPVPTTLGTPPAPENVTATPAIRNVIVEWDELNYTGHAYAEVWGSSTNDLGAAELLGQTPGFIYTDALGPSSTRYYWVRNVNTDNVAGPYNAVSGTVATTGADLAYTMDILSDTYGGTSEAPFFQLDAPQVIGGVTIPAGTYIKAAFIYDAEITNAKIANLAVDSAKIADLAVTTAKIADANITTAKIANANITTAKIANAAITTALIGDAQITTAKIVDANITTAKIADANITTAKIADANITTAKIANAAITNALIANAAITSAKIGDGEITNAKIGDTIQSSNFVSGSTGWRILKTGSAEFNDVVISRQMQVASGYVGAGANIGYGWVNWDVDTGYAVGSWSDTSTLVAVISPGNELYGNYYGGWNNIFPELWSEVVSVTHIWRWSGAATIRLSLRAITQNGSSGSSGFAWYTVTSGFLWRLYVVT